MDRMNTSFHYADNDKNGVLDREGKTNLMILVFILFLIYFFIRNLYCYEKWWFFCSSKCY